MKLPHWDRVNWILGVAACLFGLLAIGAGTYAWRMHQLMLREQVLLQAEYAQLTGLAKSSGKFSEIETSFQRQIADYAYPHKLDATQAGNEAQQRIREILSSAKLDIVSIQVLPAVRDDRGFDRIPVTVRIEGLLPGLQTALQGVSQQRPIIGIESATIQTVGAARAGTSPRLSAQLMFFVFRQRNP